MSEPTEYTPSPPPEGYNLAHSFFMTQRKALLWMNLVGFGLFVLAAVALVGIMLPYWALIAPPSLEQFDDPLSLIIHPLIWLALLIAVMVVHEGLHGFTIALLGFKPRYGMKLRKLVLFTTTDAYFTRGQYLAVTLAPLVVITAVGVLIMLVVPLLTAIGVGLAVAVNFSGAVGDMWMAAVMASFPPEARFRDEADGMSIYLPEA